LGHKYQQFHFRDSFEEVVLGLYPLKPAVQVGCAKTSPRNQIGETKLINYYNGSVRFDV